MHHKFKLEVSAKGNYTEQELMDFIEWILEGNNFDPDNPFIENLSEIISAQIYK